MNTRRPRAFALLGLMSLAAVSPPNLSGDAVLVEAVRTAADVHARLGRGFRPLMRRAKAVLIAPNGRSGTAILLLHTPTGWSEPAFFAAGAFTSAAPAMLLVMTDRATDAILRQAGLPPDGPDALGIAAMKPGAAADLLLWSPDPHEKASQDGPRQDDGANAAFYGHPRNAADIVGFTPPELRSSKLRAALGG